MIHVPVDRGDVEIWCSQYNDFVDSHEVIDIILVPSLPCKKYIVQNS